MPALQNDPFNPIFPGPSVGDSHGLTLQKICLALNGGGSTGGVGGFQIPKFDSIANTYYGATNNVHVVTYKLAGVTVRTLTFSYVGGGASSNDNISAIAAS